MTKAGQGLPGEERWFFNVTLDAETRRWLDELAERERCSRAQVVRAALAVRWIHRCAGAPMCGSGQRCLVPHMHPPVERPVPSALAHSAAAGGQGEGGAVTCG